MKGTETRITDPHTITASDINPDSDDAMMDDVESGASILERGIDVNTGIDTGVDMNNIMDDSHHHAGHETSLLETELGNDGNTNIDIDTIAAPSIQPPLLSPSPSIQERANMKAYSWRPPTPPPSPPKTNSNSNNNNGDFNKIFTFKGIGIGMPSLFRKKTSNIAVHPNQTNTDGNSISNRNSSPHRLADESLLLTNESDPHNLTHDYISTGDTNDTDNDYDIRTQTQIHTHARNVPRKHNPYKHQSRISKTIHALLPTSPRPEYDDTQSQQNDQSSTYQMMKSQHGASTRQSKNSLSAITNLPPDQSSFFYNGMDQLQLQRSSDYSSSSSNRKSSSSISPSSDDYFNHQTRRNFMEKHALLNASYSRPSISSSNSLKDEQEHAQEEDYFQDNDSFDLSTLFTFGMSHANRDRHDRQRFQQRNEQPIMADIRKSSLSYMRKGRMEMRVPGDNVRLVMDEFLDAGILSVEVNSHSEFELEPQSCSGGENDRDGDGKRNRMNGNDRDDENENKYSNRGTSSGLEGTAMRTVGESSSLEQQETDIETGAVSVIEQRAHIERSGLIQLSESRQQKQAAGDLNVDLDYAEDVAEDAQETSRLPELRYMLTVDQNLYKRVLSEITDSRMPCGLYYCCNDSVDGTKHVQIRVAILILIVFFIFLFVGTCIWPTD